MRQCAARRLCPGICQSIGVSMDERALAPVVSAEFVAADARVSTAGKEVALTRAGALRLDAIDLLRGLVIVLMVLDHIRDYVHAPALVFNPTDLTQTSPL